MSSVPTVQVTEAAQRPDGVMLLDVREDHEWAAGHAPDAVHRPLAELDATAVPEGSTVYCICRSGARSAQAVGALMAQGIDAYNVDGGMFAWAADDLPVITDAGAPGHVL